MRGVPAGLGEGVAQAHRRKINGKPGWQAVRVITVKQVMTDPDTGKPVLVKTKKRLTGTGQTKTEAEARLDERVLDFRVLMKQDPNSADLRPKKKQDSVTMGVYLDLWLNHKAEGGRRKIDANSLDLYRTRIDTHIRPDLGDRKLKSLSRAELDAYIWRTLPAKRKQVRDDDGVLVDGEERLLGGSAIRSIHSILKQTFDLAVKNGVLDFNPVLGIELPEPSRMTEEEEARIVAHHYIPRRVVKGLWGKPELGRWILMFMGLRSAERLGVEIGAEGSLRYLENPDKPTELTINRQLDVDRKTRQWFVKFKTKTKSGKRILLLPTEVSDHLLLWKNQRDVWEKQGKADGTWNPEPGLENLLFVQPNGRAIRLQKDRLAWRKLLAELKLPYHREHNMRHMTASLLASAGVKPSVAKVILGHSSELMTFYYQHLSGADTAVPLADVAGVITKDVSASLKEISFRDDGTSEPVETLDATALVGVLFSGDDETEEVEQVTA